jgi:hypothetical protein
LVRWQAPGTDVQARAAHASGHAHFQLHLKPGTTEVTRCEADFHQRDLNSTNGIFLGDTEPAAQAADRVDAGLLARQIIEKTLRRNDFHKNRSALFRRLTEWGCA